MAKETKDSEQLKKKISILKEIFGSVLLEASPEIFEAARKIIKEYQYDHKYEIVDNYTFPENQLKQKLAEKEDMVAFFDELIKEVDELEEARNETANETV